MKPTVQVLAKLEGGEAPDLPASVSDADRYRYLFAHSNFERAKLTAEIAAREAEGVSREIAATYNLRKGDSFDPQTGVITRAPRGEK